MANFILRKIDDALWQRVKVQAARDAAERGQPAFSLRWLVTRLLELYAEQGLTALEQAPKG